MKIFISYSRKDRQRVEPVVHALRNEGHHVFFDVGSLELSDVPGSAPDDPEGKASLLTWKRGGLRAVVWLAPDETGTATLPLVPAGAVHLVSSSLPELAQRESMPETWPAHKSVEVVAGQLTRTSFAE